MGRGTSETELLSLGSTQYQVDDKVFLITTYHTHDHSLGHHLHQLGHVRMKRNHGNCAQHGTESGYRRPPNLRDTLIQANVPYLVKDELADPNQALWAHLTTLRHTWSIIDFLPP